MHRAFGQGDLTDLYKIIHITTIIYLISFEYQLTNNKHSFLWFDFRYENGVETSISLENESRQKVLDVIKNLALRSTWSDFVYTLFRNKAHLWCIERKSMYFYKSMDICYSFYYSLLLIKKQNGSLFYFKCCWSTSYYLHGWW